VSDGDLERPPSLWPWVIGAIVVLIVVGSIVGALVHAVFELLIFVAIIAIIIWGVTRLVGGRRR
jgi:hypothetical protein